MRKVPYSPWSILTVTGIIFSVAAGIFAWSYGLLASIGCILGGIVITALIAAWGRKNEAAYVAILAEELERLSPEQPTSSIIVNSQVLQPVLMVTQRFMSDLYILRHSFSTMTTPFILLNPSGIILHVSIGFCNLFSVQTSAVSGKTINTVLKQFFPAENLPVLPSKQALHQVLSYSNKEGHKLELLLTATPLTKHNSEQAEIILEFFDQTATLACVEAMQAKERQTLASGLEMNALAKNISSASEELSAVAQEHTQGARKQKIQAAAVVELMDNMQVTVHQVGQSVERTSDTASLAQTNASEGSRFVTEAIDGIHGVMDSAKQLETVLQQLEKQAGEISRVINIINDIADQTNLLALNAAIEAARAGDAGRGFAVVADEVRKLADKTVNATSEVESVVRTIQSSTHEAMESMQQTHSLVDIR